MPFAPSRIKPQNAIPVPQKGTQKEPLNDREDSTEERPTKRARTEESKEQELPDATAVDQENTTVEAEEEDLEEEEFAEAANGQPRAADLYLDTVCVINQWLPILPNIV